MNPINLPSIIGPLIANDLYRDQADLVEAACDENEDGVRRVAAEVMADRNVQNPTPVFLARIKRRQHLKPSRSSQQRGAAKLSALERAELAYHGKIAHLNEHGALERGWTQEDAIAYAIDYTKGATSDTEAALRERLGLPAYRGVAAPANWSDVLKMLAAGKTNERPSAAPAGLSDETAADLLKELA